MKKKILNIAVLMTLGWAGTSVATAQVAQVKIGENPTMISPNAVLEIESRDKGLLLPRLALTSTDSFTPLTAHVAGMTVYNTAMAGTDDKAVTPGYYYNDGAKWVRIATGADLKTEPWYDQATNAEATSNTQNIYQMANVAVGKVNNYAGTALDVQGAVRGGNSPAGTVGPYSAAFGHQNIASGAQSVALVNRSEATGNSSFAAGDVAIASGLFSIALGSQSEASETYSIVMGQGLIADDQNETVLGRFNDDNASLDALLQLGNGASVSSRSNALTVLKNGNIGTDIATNPTERLDIGSGNVRVRDINTNTGAATDNVVVADASGVLKTLKAAMPKFFYMPSIIVPTSEEQLNATGAGKVTGDAFNDATRQGTIQLHTRYAEQFGLTGTAQASSTGAPALPVLPADELHYYVTWYDINVFETVSVSNTGVLTYTVKSDADITIGSFMNIVFAVRED